MSTYTQNIAHIDMDTFFVSVERLLDPKLKGRPVVVGGNPFGRGVVAGCSYEARAFGIRSAMPIRRAYQLCPSAVYLPGHYQKYSEYSKQVTEMLADLVPAMEKSSVDEFYLDLSRSERLKGNAFEWAKQIQRTVNGETKLPLSLGLAANKLVAKVATTQVAKQIEVKHHQVLTGSEAAFLAPYPIRALPGIGEVTEHFLLEHNIEKIGQLAASPKEIMGRLLGKTGHSLVDRAKGIDNSPLIITRDQRTYSRESTFEEDTLNVENLFGILLALSSQLATDLRKAKKQARTFTLKLRYTDFSTYSRAHTTTSYTNSDQPIFKIAKKLLVGLWTRRMRVRLLGIEASKLVDDLEQDYLFEELGDNKTLCRAFDKIRAKHGNTMIRYAAAID